MKLSILPYTDPRSQRFIDWEMNRIWIIARHNGVSEDKLTMAAQNAKECASRETEVTAARFIELFEASIW